MPSKVKYNFRCIPRTLESRLLKYKVELNKNTNQNLTTSEL